MCGIAGVLKIYQPGEPIPPHHESIPDAWLDTLDESIKHRGPDGQGRFRDRAIRPDGTTVDVALVHRRLSIIDHAGGSQPMVHLRHQDGTGELLRQPSTPDHPHKGAPNVRDVLAADSVHPQTPPTLDTTHKRAPSVSDGPKSTGVPSPTETPRSRSGLFPGGTGFQPVSPQSPPHTIDATALPQTTDLIAVAFNGCIYNHRELRSDLEAAGHRFQTDHADTEVLIHGWREHGLRLQDELDGMYAALIWDRRTGQLAEAVDDSGEKPLTQVIPITQGLLVYSSVNTGLTRLLAHQKPEAAYVYEPGIESWIQYGSDRIPATPSYNRNQRWWKITPSVPTQNADPLPHSEIDPRHRSGRRRKSLPDRGKSRSSPEAEHNLRERIESAVSSRLEADAPLGLFLSGGIDSALIAAIAVKHRPDIDAFTVRMPEHITPLGRKGPHFDESQAAAETAAHLGLTHHILDCDAGSSKSNPADDLVMLIEQLGLPFGDSSLLPTYWVAKAARQHVKVTLSGDGGDELFGGYRRHTINPTLHRSRHLLRLIPDALLPQRHPGSRSTYLARLATAARHGGYSELLSIFPTPDLRRLIPEIDGERPGDDHFHPIDDPLGHDFQHYLPDDLLRKTDTASMAVALEVRCPFLARDLVDAAMRTPLDVLMPKNERKGLLKQIARNYLPPHIINRPKQGFAIPIGDWFRSDFGSLRQLLCDHLLSADPFPGLADAGININTDVVRRLLREHDAAGERSPNPWHGRDHSQRLYMLLVLAIWCRWLDRLRTDSEPNTRNRLPHNGHHPSDDTSG